MSGPVYVRTPSGLVTSYREAWKDKQGRPVWTWRIDKGAAPHDFGTVEAALAWIDDVEQLLTDKERDAEGWTVEPRMRLTDVDENSAAWVAELRKETE